jgi:hypothetical protein
VGNAGGDFQADEVCVFATTLGCLRKLGRCSVAEAAVWPFFVVLLPPTCDLDACIEQVPEPTHTQALFSESAVKALHMGVLTHCQLHRHRNVQEDVFELLIHFIHGLDESLNWLSIAGPGARIESFSTTRESDSSRYLPPGRTSLALIHS